MKTWFTTATLALALASSAAPLAAQPFAQALGHPLPAKDTPVGTVTVRLIAGAIGKPVIGADVTLVVNGTPRIARTDAGGHASFAELPANATVQVKILDEDKKEISSDQFQISGDTGTRLMMSTRPMGGGGPMGGGDGGGAAGAGGPMIDPRQASGQPRYDQQYDKGTVTIIALYGDFKDPAADVPVALVGYHSDDTITVDVKPTFKDGRAEFRNLDITGNTEYFAMTELPRNGALDRGYGRPLELDGRGGVHIILSGAKRNDTTTPPVDDFTVVQHQDNAPAAGKVRIVVSGVVDSPAIKIIDASTKQLVAEGKAGRLPFDASQVQFESQFAARQDLEKGMLGVVIHGGPTGGDVPQKGIAVSLVPDGGSATAASQTATTDADGQAILHVPIDPAQKYKLVANVNGAMHTSESFEVGTTGGALEVVARWDARGRIEALIDVPQIPGRVMYAESNVGGTLYRTAPFQTIPTAGTVLQMYFVPRVWMTFHLGGTIEDTQLGVQGTFTISNYAWAPYAGGPDGTVVPLPRGFKGAVVAEGDQEIVAVAQGEGFRLVRPVPPGRRQFHGGFSMPTDGGVIHWAMDLPFGAFDSSIKLLKTPDMRVEAPMRVESSDAPGFGAIYAIEPIRIAPQQSMQMTISGLPTAPGWRLWVPRILGLVVIVVIVGGLVFALTRSRAPVSHATAAAAKARRDRREALLEELVELERVAREKGSLDQKTQLRKETLITQLEALWGDD